jgi:hypothetical protein
VASHVRAREQNVMPALATRHGWQPVPVPAIRWQGSPAGMLVCPPAGQQGRRTAGASDEDGGRSRRAKRKVAGRGERRLINDAERPAEAVDEDGKRSDEDGWWSNEGERRGRLAIVRWPRRRGPRSRKH